MDLTSISPCGGDGQLRIGYSRPADREGRGLPATGTDHPELRAARGAEALEEFSEGTLGKLADAVS
jgi:hypothetical protein